MRYPYQLSYRDILEDIVRKLTLVDYLKCRQICRSWRGTIDDALSTKRTPSCLHASQFPFLMLFPHTFMYNCPQDPAISAILSDITQEDTSYTIPTKTWEGYFDFEGLYVTSVQGWLVFRKMEYQSLLLFFTNPMSGEGFLLPHLPLFSGQENISNYNHIYNYSKNYSYKSINTSVKLIFSSAPYFSDFLVVAFAQVQCGTAQQLAFWKANDKSWTLISNKESQQKNFNEFVILDWKLYAMNTSGSVFVFDLRDSNNITFEKLQLEKIPKGTDNSRQTCMLARDKDEILLVHHFYDTICETTKGFRVFKLDISGSRWIEVDDLGDRILLMDYTGVQVLSAKKIKLRGELNGGNFVFFVDDPFMLREQYDFGVFSLKDKTITRFPLGRSSQGRIIRCLWFMVEEQDS
ncbi:F-box protein SKIP23 [Trifolium repens]|nr:F-box protein SKIP23 [Trifolium repens]